MTKKNIPKKADTFRAFLEREYPDASCSLSHASALQLLVATILSAQCTDVRVNIVTKDLFKKYKKAKDFADADIKELERDVHSTGFYKNKAKSIKSSCATIVEKHGGHVPKTLDELLELRGIGRKTANVILGNAFGVPGVVVDTHVGRISRRLGFTKSKDPVKIEFELMGIFPEGEWTKLGHQIIEHGRKVCTSRSPRCGECGMQKKCDYGKQQKNG